MTRRGYGRARSRNARRTERGEAAGTKSASSEAEEPLEGTSFVEHIRASAPYIHAHRGRTFVVTFGGEAVEGRGLRHLVHDLALLHGLGVRLVLVAGARPQIERRLKARGRESRYAQGLRITDDEALACVKEATATVRLEMEALLSMGLPTSPMGGARIRVAAGNFVTARPVGVVDGIDFMHTGVVRRIDGEAIRERLDAGTVVLLSPVGYSATGEVFNLAVHDVATAAAVAVEADKLVSLVEGRGVVDPKGRTVHELTPDEAEDRLARRSRLGDDVRRHLDAAVRACRNGVPRAHLVPRRIDGGVLHELLTRDGIGTLVTSETYEGVRPARLDDLAGILELVEPLEQQGVLARRSRERLETGIEHFTVVERDGMVVACAALYAYPEQGMAELASVAVHPRYRQAERGDRLVDYLERRCRDQGLTCMFVLTTVAEHWFRERGFEPGRARDLPAARRQYLDRRRRSKVLLKQL